MNNINEILSDQDLTALQEDTGLTAAEINREYELAVAKAKAESAPKKAMNRFQRRKQEQKLKKIFNSYLPKETEIPVSKRFDALPEKEKINLYTRILSRVREENAKFDNIKENENGEGVS